MKTILLIKDVYLEGFQNLGRNIVKHYFKAFAWFTAAMWMSRSK
ncbi:MULTISPECIES: DUF6747 family protein [Arenibacter]|nr:MULTISPECIES: DUF6747 family protein [Arenibacter]